MMMMMMVVMVGVVMSLVMDRSRGRLLSRRGSGWRLSVIVSTVESAACSLLSLRVRGQVGKLFGHGVPM